MRALLLMGMALMIPCYLFTVLNTLLSPWPLYDRNRPLLLLLTALCLLLLLAALRGAARLEAAFVRRERMCLAAAALFYLIVQMGLACALRYTPKTDLEQCVTAARLIVEQGTFAQNERSVVYFSRYPHNLGLVYAFAAILRVCRLLGVTDSFLPSVFVVSLLFSLGLLSSARLCRRLGGACAELRVLLLFGSCLPFLYASSELYTDAFSLAFPPVIVLCAVRAREADSRRGRALFALAFAASSFVGAQLRFTSIIAAIACLIALLLQKRPRLTAACALALAFAFAVGGAGMDAETARHLTAEQLEQNELPKLHYIAMGLPVQEDEGYGQYGSGGWLLFSTSFEDPDARDAALLEEVIDRIYYVRYPSRLLSLLSRKNLSTFGNGAFLLNEIIEADAHEPDNPVKQVIFEGGALYGAYYHLTTALFCAQLLLACAACAQAVRRKDTRAAAVMIALLGAFLFLSMWETRARYFFQFEMLLLCAAALLEPPARQRRGIGGAAAEEPHPGMRPKKGACQP